MAPTSTRLNLIRPRLDTLSSDGCEVKRFVVLLVILLTSIRPGFSRRDRKRKAKRKKVSLIAASSIIFLLSIFIGSSCLFSRGPGTQVGI